MILREYQSQGITDIKNAFRFHKRVFYQLPTGAGKTMIFSEITRQASIKGTISWIVVPRRELRNQASKKLVELNVNHGIIAPGFNETIAYTTHVVSKDTWKRRKDKIKTKPKLIIIDEGHLAIDSLVEIQKYYSDAYYLIVSATPERLDVRGLSEIADILICGPSMKFMIEREYLCRMSCYCPPLDGLDKLKRSGTEYNQKALEEFLNGKMLYGKAIDHYREHAEHEPCIIFCRSVKLAEQCADKFNKAGYNFMSIDGTMSDGKRDRILSNLKNRHIDGITSCDLVTYGLDVPIVSCIIMLRPTKSRSLFYQMIGRGTRFEDGKILKVFDHAGNIREHCRDRMPWDSVEWNFNGNQNRRKKNVEQSIKFCPYIDFAPCMQKTCLRCAFNPNPNKPITEFKEIDGKLIAINDSVKIKGRPKEEKDHYLNRIERLEREAIINETESVKGESDGKYGFLNIPAISELLKIAEETGRNPMWVYHLLTKDWISVCTPLLFTIAEQKNYKDGWVYHKQSALQKAKSNVRSN